MTSQRQTRKRQKPNNVNATFRVYGWGFRSITFAGMKYITLLTIGTLFAFASYSQLNIQKGTTDKPLSEYRKQGQLVAYLKTFVLSTGDTMYSVFYYDNKYTYVKKLTSFSLEGVNSMKDFFSLVGKMYSEKQVKDAEYIIPFGLNEEITVRWMYDDVFLIVKDGNGTYSSLVFTRKMLDKLNVL